MPRKPTTRTSTSPTKADPPQAPDSPLAGSVMEQRLARQEARAADPNAKDMKTVLFEQGTKPIIEKG